MTTDTTTTPTTTSTSAPASITRFEPVTQPVPTAQWQYHHGGRRQLRVGPTPATGAAGATAEASLFLCVEDQAGPGAAAPSTNLELLRFGSPTTARRFIRVLNSLLTCPAHLETGATPFSRAGDRRSFSAFTTRWTGLHATDLQEKSGTSVRRDAHDNLTLQRPRLEIHPGWTTDQFVLREPAQDALRQFGEFLGPEEVLILRRELSLLLDDAQHEHQPEDPDPLSAQLEQAQIVPQGFWRGRIETLRLITPARLNASYLVLGDDKLTVRQDILASIAHDTSASPGSGIQHQLGEFKHAIDRIVHADFLEIDHDPTVTEPLMQRLSRYQVLTGDPHQSFSFRAGTIIGADLFTTEITVTVNPEAGCWLFAATVEDPIAASAPEASSHEPSQVLQTEIRLGLGPVANPRAVNELICFLLSTSTGGWYLHGVSGTQDTATFDAGTAA